MNKIIIMYVILLLLMSDKAEAGRYDDQYAGQRLQHTMAGGVIGGLVDYYYKDSWNQKYRVPCAIAAPFVTGLLYEAVFDHDTFDIGDVAEWTAGGATVVFVMEWRF